MTRVVDALKATRGVADASIEEGRTPLTLFVRFDARRTTPQRIGRAAKRALETDERNRGPVRVIYERE